MKHRSQQYIVQGYRRDQCQHRGYTRLEATSSPKHRDMGGGGAERTTTTRKQKHDRDSGSSCPDKTLEDEGGNADHENSWACRTAGAGGRGARGAGEERKRKRERGHEG